MYLHIGASASVRDRDLVGIFDLDGQMTTADTAAFLRTAEKKGITRAADETGLPKCFLLLTPPPHNRAGWRQKKKQNETVLFSPISAAALGGRVRDGVI